MATSSFPIWKTVTLGTPRHYSIAHKMLNASGIKVAEAGMRALRRVPFQGYTLTLNLVRVTILELELWDGVSTAHVYHTAKSFGLELCPAEVAPLLWLSHPELLVPGESLLVAMTPIVDSLDNQSIFRLEHTKSGRCLNATFGDLIKARLDNDSFIFVTT